MYAVIQSGGKQYRVSTGDVVQVEKLEGEKGASMKFSEVLMVAKPATGSTQIWLGKPLLSGATVSGEIVGQGRGEKVIIVKMKRRKQYRRTKGHRQNYTQVLITSLANGAGETMELSASDKKNTLAKFQSHLTPRGLPMTPKTLGSRKRLAAEKTALIASGGSLKTPKTASATKAPKSTETKAAPKAAKKPSAKSE